MKLELIENDKSVLSYHSDICPAKGETIKSLSYVIRLWEVKEVRHVVNLIDHRDVEEKVILNVELIS